MTNNLIKNENEINYSIKNLDLIIRKTQMSNHRTKLSSNQLVINNDFTI